MCAIRAVEGSQGQEQLSVRDEDSALAELPDGWAGAHSRGCCGSELDAWRPGRQVRFELINPNTIGSYSNKIAFIWACAMPRSPIHSPPSLCHSESEWEDWPLHPEFGSERTSGTQLQWQCPCTGQGEETRLKMVMGLRIRRNCINI